MKSVVVCFSALVLLAVAQCKPRGIKPECNLHMKTGCPRNFDPLCGTNEKTYANLCELCVAHYTNTEAGKSGINIGHPGECENGDKPQQEQRTDDSANTIYPRPAICRPPAPRNDGNMRACNRMLQQVCGSNGKTYGNECMLCLGIDESKETIQVTKEGQC